MTSVEFVYEVFVYPINVNNTQTHKKGQVELIRRMALSESVGVRSAPSLLPTHPTAL